MQGPATQPLTPFVVVSPGFELRGHSVAKSYSSAPELRLPTILNVLGSDRHVKIEASKSDKVGSAAGAFETVLLLHNFTVASPVDTWQSLQQRNASGLQARFDTSAGTRFCFANRCAT